MKIKDYLKKIFFKKQNNNSALARFSDILPMPTRNDFLEERTMLDLINKYKENYEEILLMPKYYIGESLYASNLYEEMKMNLDLVVFNFFKDEENISKSQISTLILKEKLKLYYDAILTMKYEVEARIIALNEILKEKKFIAKSKRNTIANEINRLYITLILFASQRQAILTKIEVCLNNVLVKETKDLISNNLDKENKQIITEKLIALKKRTLEEYQKVLPYFYQIRDDKDNILKDLALIERELEIYTNKNKDKIASYLDEIRRIASTSLNANNKEELLKKLEDIELNFLVFRTYGKNLIADDVLESLYTLKFRILTYSPNGICESLANYKMHDSELEYYKEIISAKIYFFRLGNDINFNNFFKEDSVLAIETISKLIETNNIYDPEEILKDKLKLNLLLALNNKDGLKNFYLNYPFTKDDIEKICPDLYKVINEENWQKIFVLTENPSIELYLWLYHLEKQNLRMNFFTLLKKHIDLDAENMYFFPEGIKEIRCDSDNSDDYLLILRKEMEGKTVIMPKSLIALNCSLFENVSLYGLCLNLGLESLGDKALSCKEIKILVIPQTLENFSSSIMDKGKIETCIFADFPYSRILNNPLLLKLFLENFVYLEKGASYQPQPTNFKNEQYPELINKDYVNNVKVNTFNIGLKIDRIILVNGANIHVINTKDLHFGYYKNNEDRIFYDQEVLNPMPYDIEAVAERINTLVIDYTYKDKKIVKKTIKRKK